MGEPGWVTWEDKYAIFIRRRLSCATVASSGQLWQLAPSNQGICEMSEIRFDVVGLGNAIVDVMSKTDDAFLEKWGIHKNAMNLIEEDRAEALTKAAVDPFYTSGGSGANTIAGLASFGARAAYIGKVSKDELGSQFTREMTASGVPFATKPLESGPATARSIIFVTEDGARSMNTFLGASVLFSKDDVDENTVRAGGILYLEGYLFDREDAKEAFVFASEIAKAAGRKVALTLSDKFCVDRHRASFLQLVRNNVDILFANEEELLSLYETEDFDAALAALQQDTAVAAVTRSEKGSVVIGAGDPISVKAEPVDQVLDTTGAGDQYAAGFLFGISRGLPLETCAHLGHIAAAEVIAHFGPRPEQSYKTLAEQAGIYA
jgi:sugar/nucleoside kinase (ribokinase family)